MSDYSKIINFNVDNLFTAENDSRYVSERNRKYIIEKIRELQKQAKKVESTRIWDTHKAFEYCGMYATNTPNEALGYYIIKVLQSYIKSGDGFVEYVNNLIDEKGDKIEDKT